MGEKPDRPAKPAKVAPPKTRTPTPRSGVVIDQQARTNLALRIPHPLDDDLVQLIHDLRLAGIKTTKVELISMLLAELPRHPDGGLRDRLRAYRALIPDEL